MGRVQALLVAYYAIRLGIIMTKNGEDRPEEYCKYNAIGELITTIILFIVLGIGGFFG